MLARSTILNYSYICHLAKHTSNEATSLTTCQIFGTTGATKQWFGRQQFRQAKHALKIGQGVYFSMYSFKVLIEQTKWNPLEISCNPGFPTTNTFTRITGLWWLRRATHTHLNTFRFNTIYVKCLQECTGLYGEGKQRGTCLNLYSGKCPSNTMSTHIHGTDAYKTCDRPSAVLFW